MKHEGRQGGEATTSPSKHDRRPELDARRVDVISCFSQLLNASLSLNSWEGSGGLEATVVVKGLEMGKCHCCSSVCVCVCVSFCVLGRGGGRDSSSNTVFQALLFRFI